MQAGAGEDKGITTERPTGRGSVAAVVVSYNVRELLLECVGSLVRAREAGELQDLVVVDNASSDGSADAVRATFPAVRVIAAPNRGYGAGVNTGIAATTSDYVLALNPDTDVPPGTIRELAGYLVQHPHAAVVGPLLRYPDGNVQPTRRRFPTPLTPVFESTIFAEWWPDNRWARRYHMRDVTDPGTSAREVDWLVGACLLVRRAAIERVGGFDEVFRMYSEEVEWCWRFRRHGWKVVWLPCVEVIHHEGASTRQDIPSRQVAFDTSRIRLTRRLHGPRWSSAVHFLLLLGYVVSLGREGGKWLLGHRRGLRRTRVALYWQALRSGLRETERV